MTLFPSGEALARLRNERAAQQTERRLVAEQSATYEAGRGTPVRANERRKRRKPAEPFTGHCQPASLDVTPAIKPGAENRIAILATRTFLNELGTGGLQAPPVLYREKD